MSKVVLVFSFRTTREYSRRRVGLQPRRGGPLTCPSDTLSPARAGERAGVWGRAQRYGGVPVLPCGIAGTGSTPPFWFAKWRAFS